MSTKYYTHFLMQERPAGALANDLAGDATSHLNEFRGVVEVNRKLRRDDFREAAMILARNFECNVHDIKVLQWSLLH
ncbi:MAG: hypothetical protein AB7F79_04610 [Steroidobacteraceae bacterium]